MKLDALNRELAEDSQAFKGKPSRNGAKIQSWLSSWASFGRRINLSGLRPLNPDGSRGETIYDAASIQAKLAEDWSKVFAARSADTDGLDLFFRKF